MSMYANLSLGLQAAGAVSGAIGGFYGAKVTKNQLAFEASMARINARIPTPPVRAHPPSPRKLYRPAATGCTCPLHSNA